MASTHSNSNKDYYATDWNRPKDPGAAVFPVAKGTISQVVAPSPMCPGSDYGCQVIVNHSSGIRTRYAHLKTVNKTSGAVSLLNKIGSVGSTGNSTGAHLHLSFQKKAGSGTYSGQYVSFCGTATNGQKCDNGENPISPQTPKPSPMRTANGPETLIDGTSYKSGHPPHPPGWYRNSGSGPIYEDSKLRITWQNSYIYKYPGNSALYWYAQVKYFNKGSQPQPLTCSGQANPSLAKEHIRHGSTYLGAVPAEETFCSRNPGWNGSVNPGGTFNSWAIFHNVPGRGNEVRLEWGSYGFSPWVDPWYSPFTASTPAVCPPELVTLGVCP